MTCEPTPRTLGFGFAWSDSGCFDSRNSIHWNPPGKCLEMRLKRGCHMAIHGLPLHCCPSSLPMGESGSSQWRPLSSLRGEIAPTFKLGDAFHLEMSWSGFKVKQTNFLFLSPSCRIIQGHGIWPGGLLKIKSFFLSLKKISGNGCEKCEQILTSNCIYLRRAKAWVPNSTMSRQRDKI